MIDNPRELGTGWKRVGSYCGRSAKIRRNHDASGSLILQNFTRFAACGIGFHRIPTYRSGNQIHPTGWSAPTSVSRTAASGCRSRSRSGSGTSAGSAPGSASSRTTMPLIVVAVRRRPRWPPRVGVDVHPAGATDRRTLHATYDGGRTPCRTATGPGRRRATRSRVLGDARRRRKAADLDRTSSPGGWSPATPMSRPSNAPKSGASANTASASREETATQPAPLSTHWLSTISARSIRRAAHDPVDVGVVDRTGPDQRRRGEGQSFGRAAGAPARPRTPAPAPRSAALRRPRARHARSPASDVRRTAARRRA